MVKLCICLKELLQQITKYSFGPAENSDVLKLFSAADQDVKTETCADFENFVTNFLKMRCSSGFSMEAKVFCVSKLPYCLTRPKHFPEFSHLKNFIQIVTLLKKYYRPHFLMGKLIFICGQLNI